MATAPQPNFNSFGRDLVRFRENGWTNFSEAVCNVESILNFHPPFVKVEI